MTCRTCDLYERMGLSQYCPCTHINGRCTSMERDTEETSEHPNGTAAPNANYLVRGQQDDHESNEYYGKLTATTPVGESLTRQEFKEDTDVNVILSRFGVNTQVRNDMVFTEVDYTIGLQEAINSVTIAKRAELNVPDELREKYPDWLSLMSGIERGEYQEDLKQLASTRAEEKRRKQLDQRKADIRSLRDAQREVEAEDAAERVRTGARAPEATPKP